ncbi:MAG: type II toxin-antitoxin system VapC family toxin [Candidatus Eremiobacterota bacterium]
MISALDTTVLLDVLLPDPTFGPGSMRVLAQAYDEGSLTICPIVYAELAPHFEQRQALEDALKRLNVRLSDGGPEVAFAAGRAWRDYRRAGGMRERILPDFFIGAHAELTSNRLVSRDRGFYRTYFPTLTLLEPAGLR